jgi:acyl carrier protein
MSENALQRIRTTIARELGVDPASLTPDTPLLGGDLALDSITLLEVLLALEEKFGVELDALELEKARALRSLSALAGFIESRT